jgi:hypothetical protein
MDKAAVLAEVKRVVDSLPGVEAMEILDRDFHDQLIAIETTAEENGACGGLMPFTNKGVWAALSREVNFVIVVQSKSSLFDLDSAKVFIQDEKGQLVGEWLTESRLKDLQGRDNLCFIAPDFVLYTDVHSEGEPRFVLPEVPFHFIENVPGVENVVSGSISTLADDYIRRRMNLSGPNHWTHLVGFDLARATK